MRLILIRHGESLWNWERRVQGCRSDTELSQRGKGQAERIAAAMKNQKVAAIYSSPLKRATDTAKTIAQACHLGIKVAPDLRELDCGELEGLSQEELGERYGIFWREWQKGSPSLHLPGGESLEELQRRAWGEIEHIVERHPDEAVAVISHLFANLTIICRALGINLGNMKYLRQDPTAISILEITEQGSSLLLFNDTCHLEAK